MPNELLPSDHLPIVPLICMPFDVIRAVGASSVQAAHQVGLPAANQEPTHRVDRAFEHGRAAFQPAEARPGLERVQRPDC